MRRLIATALLALLAAAPANAEEPRRQPSPAQAAQQQRMRDCNADAGRQNLRGEARSGFMRECLSGRAPAAGTAPAGTPAAGATPPAATPPARTPPAVTPPAVTPPAVTPPAGRTAPAGNPPASAPGQNR